MASPQDLRLAPTGWPELDPEVRRRTEAQLLFRSPLLQIGRFRARPGDRHFRCSGPPGQHVFVFPRTSVGIRHAGAEPFVTDRELVTFYNPHQLYFREAVSPDGDECDWISLRPDVVERVALEVDPQAEPGSPAPFRQARGPCDASAYLLQRTLLAAVVGNSAPDPAFLEETAIELLARLLRAACGRGHGSAERTGLTARRRRELGEAARARLALTYDRSQSLEELALELGCSVGHLCRVFRWHTGSTIHAHRDGLRLREALDRLQSPGLRLVDLAFELGYVSHSHFTAAFKRRFGVAPDWLRRHGTPRGVRRMLGARPASSAA